MPAWSIGCAQLVVDSHAGGRGVLEWLPILWEVDHQGEFPRSGGERRVAVLSGFTKWVTGKVAQDAEVSAWLEWRYTQKPLALGLPASHHICWSVQVVQPPPSGLHV